MKASGASTHTKFRFDTAILGIVMVLIVLMPVPGLADVRLPRVISSSMVLQRDMPLPVWGWADPGERVTVGIGRNEVGTKADGDGKWMVKLPAMKAGGPHTMTVTGKNSITLTDILVGEVWLCSGQSNMEMSVSRVTNARLELSSAEYPRMRLFHVRRTTSGEPKEDCIAEWRPVTPVNVAAFSAVGYFFGRELHAELDVPVGLINSSWGGTRIEPWTPPEGFAQNPELKDIVERIQDAGADYHETQATALDGYRDWMKDARASLKAKKTPPAPPVWPKHGLDVAWQPTALYNGMIHPLVPFAIRGAIWYQGEANRSDGMLYHEKKKALINGWRTVWGQGDFPFYYVQLAPYRYRGQGQMEPYLLPGIWEAQTASLSIPNTGMAVTVDIGNVNDIHPTNKQEVGRRLSLWALAKTYGRDDIVYSGPLYRSMSVSGNSVTVRFDHTGGGLKTSDGRAPTWFELAGDDGRFVRAVAEIAGDTVIVRSEEVGRPAAVRYGWNEEAEPNLVNSAGLPVSPFRNVSR